MFQDVAVDILKIYRKPLRAAFGVGVEAVGVVAAIVGGAVGSSTGVVASIGLAVFGFVVGAVSIGSHIAADALTPAGVRPFAPVRTRRYTYTSRRRRIR
ncbi:MAG: hypothetical protein ABEH56_03645 [Salinirussus sp.]